MLGSSPQWTRLLEPPLWGGGSLAGAPGGRGPVCSPSAFPHLHARSLPSRSACPFRCRPKGCSSQAFAPHLLRQFNHSSVNSLRLQTYYLSGTCWGQSVGSTATGTRSLAPLVVPKNPLLCCRAQGECSGTLNLNSWAIGLPGLSSEWLTDGSEGPGPPEIIHRFPVSSSPGEVPRSQQELRGAHAEKGPSILVPSTAPGGHIHTCVFSGHHPAKPLMPGQTPSPLHSLSARAPDSSWKPPGTWLGVPTDLQADRHGLGSGVRPEFTAGAYLPEMCRRRAPGYLGPSPVGNVQSVLKHTADRPSCLFQAMGQ